ncbi:hypothetical protein [Hyphomicrobium sp. ghe19]|uniref:hypothetical protein n=1 Tax=Hyphomicrobium sp. ghe19 TaxID=2682968 RepID=UPI00136793A7|nr:hypothetical protein HYPP_02435 [Hyphomicrobium sp. ghe19]
MPEINYAELEERLQTNPTLAMCERQGSTHRAYGWAPNPWGHWTAMQKAAYMQGYNDHKKRYG